MTIYIFLKSKYKHFAFFITKKHQLTKLTCASSPDGTASIRNSEVRGKIKPVKLNDLLSKKSFTSAHA